MNEDPAGAGPRYRYFKIRVLTRGNVLREGTAACIERIEESRIDRDFATAIGAVKAGTCCPIQSPCFCRVIFKIKLGITIIQLNLRTAKIINADLVLGKDHFDTIKRLLPDIPNTFSRSPPPAPQPPPALPPPPPGVAD